MATLNPRRAREPAGRSAGVRTTLLLASALALVGFLAYPTAPPRLAGIGIADAVSDGRIDLNKMHIGYALIVAAGLLLYGRRFLTRLLGVLYPPFVLLIVAATGNHFFVDAAAAARVRGARGMIHRTRGVS